MSVFINLNTQYELVSLFLYKLQFYASFHVN